MNIEKIRNRIVHDTDYINKVIDLYGINYADITICTNHDLGPITIAINTPNKDVFVLMDEEYNTIGIYRVGEFGENKANLELAAYEYQTLHRNLGIFYGLTLKNIEDLANRVEVWDNESDDKCTLVNNQIIKEDDDSLYMGLLSYISFLGNEINNYYKDLYRMKMMGIKFPSLPQYLSSTINVVEGCVADYISMNRRPYPVDVVRSLGRYNSYQDECYNALLNAIGLILRQNGYVVGKGSNYKYIYKTEMDTTNLSEIAEELLSLLEVPLDELADTFLEETTLESLLSNSKTKKI